MSGGNQSLDARQFIAEHASQTAYWSDLAREAVVIEDDALLTYATRKAAAFARAFVGAVKDILETEERGVQ
ncbi:MAG TPA: hypothetical protein VFE60_14165 [Roseiarcus sp.]|jgi:hypothetical protein|nr:hypothetical protein [Roseiarcus sp.]